MMRLGGWLLALALGMSSVVWAQGPPNPWVRPNCELGHDAVADATSYRWYVSATPGITPDGSSYVLQQPVGTTSARCPQLGLTGGLTRYLVVTAVSAGGESPASNELWIMISSGTVDVRP